MQNPNSTPSPALNTKKCILIRENISPTLFQFDQIVSVECKVPTVPK